MRRLTAPWGFALFALFASCANFAHSPLTASADAVCTVQGNPTPPPQGIYKITIPLCDTSGHLLTTSSGGSTPIPYPTGTTGVLLVQPTSVPTLSVVCVSGCPTPLAVQPVSGTLTVNTPPPGATPIPYPTLVGGTLLVAPTALPTLSVVCVSGCPTPIPRPTNAAGLLKVAGFTGSSDGSAPVSCDKSSFVNITSATTNAQIAAVIGQTVYVCGFHMYIEAGTLPAFQFEAGTQTATPCDTGGQFKAGKYGGIASAVGEVFTFGGSLGQIFISGVSGQICIVSSGTTPNIQGIMDYAQF